MDRKSGQQSFPGRSPPLSHRTLSGRRGEHELGRSVRQVFHKQPNLVAAHDLADVLRTKPGLHQRLGHLDHTGGVEGHLHRAVEIRAEADMVHADQVGLVALADSDRLRVLAADAVSQKPIRPARHFPRRRATDRR